MPYKTNSIDNNIINILKGGGVGCLPSDTIYGLSALATNKKAVQRLHSLKDRSNTKPFIILISDTKILNMLSISENQASLAKNYWPGPLTLICDAPKSADYLHLGFKTLAVRIPARPDLLRLLNITGPLISTSANPEGLSPASTAAEAFDYFGDSLDFYVDGGNLADSLPSTIAAVKDGKLEVIRQGSAAIRKEDLA